MTFDSTLRLSLAALFLGCGAPEMTTNSGASNASDSDEALKGHNGGSCEQCLAVQTHPECGGNDYCCAQSIAGLARGSYTYYTTLEEAVEACGADGVRSHWSECGEATVVKYYCESTNAANGGGSSTQGSTSSSSGTGSSGGSRDSGKAGSTRDDDRP